MELQIYPPIWKWEALQIDLQIIFAIFRLQMDDSYEQNQHFSCKSAVIIT